MNTKKQLNDMRTSLWVIAPITAWNTFGFSVFNVAFGALLSFSDINIPLKQVVSIDVHVWGILFIIHGLNMMFYLGKNNWQMTKAGLIVALFMKSAWSLQLLALCIQGAPQYVYLLLTIAIFLVYLQFVTFINFTPKTNVRGLYGK